MNPWARSLVFEKTYRELLAHISRGNADAAYILTRLLTALARTAD